MMLKTISLRHWGFFFAGVSTLVLAAVFTAQFKFGFHPCHLCLLQRRPYLAALIIALLLAALAQRRKIAIVLLGLLAVIFLVGTGLALFHFGVEHHWWTYAADCSGDVYKPGASPGEILAALRHAVVVRCDQVTPFLFGMSMAFYNILTSLALVALAIYALVSQRSNSLSQYK